jgi:DNA-binding beta-propeller fold protein YncE
VPRGPSWPIPGDSPEKAIPTGSAGAYEVTFTPDGNIAYISNLDSDTVTPIDTTTKQHPDTRSRSDPAPP